MIRSKAHPWLNRFAWLTAGATFLLLGLGGLVTSHEAGMSVPDWPTSYGYNMFLFPFHLWTGGIFYEHTHRLLASAVGLLTTILAVWIWLRETRIWLRWLGLAAFMGVVLQGVLGGLRVTLFKDEIGIFHAALAQVFFITVTLIALFVSGRGEKLMRAAQLGRASWRIRWLAAVASASILGQLILGATMRHQHAGLAIPDFPLAYGRIWPAMDEASIQRINSERRDVRDYKPITATQIKLHMAHRLTAAFILVSVAALFYVSHREQGLNSTLTRMSLGWLCLICVQASLGALTIWSNKAADVATAHVLAGALSLLAGSIISLCAFGAALTKTAKLEERLRPSLHSIPAASLSQAKHSPS